MAGRKGEADQDMRHGSESSSTGSWNSYETVRQDQGPSGPRATSMHAQTRQNARWVNRAFLFSLILFSCRGFSVDSTGMCAITRKMAFQRSPPYCYENCVLAHNVKLYVVQQFPLIVWEFLCYICSNVFGSYTYLGGGGVSS